MPCNPLPGSSANFGADQRRRAFFLLAEQAFLQHMFFFNEGSNLGLLAARDCGEIVCSQILRMSVEILARAWSQIAIHARRFVDIDLVIAWIDAQAHISPLDTTCPDFARQKIHDTARR